MDKTTERPMVGVGVFLIYDGKFIMGKRKNAHGAGMWSLPGGHVEKGETLIAAAERELLEETGIKVEATAVRKVVIACDDFFPEHDWHYVTVYVWIETEEPVVHVNTEPDKCEGWEWFDLEQSLPQPCHASTEKALLRLNDIRTPFWR